MSDLLVGGKNRCFRNSRLLLASALVVALSAVATQASEPASRTPWATPSTLSPLEKKYLETRDGFIRKFSQASAVPDSEDHQAVAKLEAQLRAIIGPVHVQGFPGFGKSNLATLDPEDEDQGATDGLRFEDGEDTLFVTTPALLVHYLAQDPDIPKDPATAIETGFLYQSVFDQEAGVTNFGHVPVSAAGGRSFAYAMLGLSAQDIGPFEPTDLFVFVSTGTRILMVHAHLKRGASSIPECRSIWDKYAMVKSDATKVYQASGLKDQKALHDMDHDEDLGFAAYSKCYGTKAKDQPFFGALEKQAQSIVERLLPMRSRQSEALH